ncbi:hypothetical protein [Sphingobium sp. D43FB]|uniref:hypothetical protein n=1 Tax=Sphingobium sp. D43FB TaxID=2017595 RepID=UPI000BB57F89|nr:hypothetical protein [Sphingobium sp. D43FB]PBN43505.1 hypothetical protein SxD43FB_10305 [Sphingobium sp. D43FB]
MPKLSERERLAELEARQRRAAEEVETARRALRGKYADIIRDLRVEAMSERVFKDLLTEAIRVGGEVSFAALKAMPTASEAKHPLIKSSAKGVPAASTV